MTEKVTKLALTSRIFLLLLQLFANGLVSDHKADVFRSPLANGTTSAVGQDTDATQDIAPTWLDKTVDYCFGGLRHWDAEYFLHIAEHRYTYENTLAFYPLYPMVVRGGAHALHNLGLGLSMRSCCLLVALLVNLYCFCKAARLLYQLTQRIFNDPNKSWNATLLFCFNPASIFFSAAYSEAIFCWLSLRIMLECVTELRFLRATVPLALSIIARSNGVVNFGFPTYFLLRNVCLKQAGHFVSLMKLAACFCIAFLPITFFYSYAFNQFCQPDNPITHSPPIVAYALERNYILAGDRQPQNSPWCDLSIPVPYSYIQSHYWNVGFLRYYKWKQLPNFMLAAPILVFLAYHCYVYLNHFVRTLLPHYRFAQLVKSYKSLPFVLHALLLTAFCTFFVHIQIATRLLCSASPCLYWFAADYMPKTFDLFRMRSKAGLVLMWFASYFIVGTTLYSNNLPWT